MGHQQPIASQRWRIPGFTELRELGAGAQGRAVLVRENASGRVAVAKYVVTAGDATAQTLFRRESVLLERVHSPYVARWFGHFEDASVSAILMEAVNGVSLKTMLGEYRILAPEAALLVLKGSLLGLAAAHELGVVHRDYKPANVIVQADGVSKLIDFGIATIAGESSRSGTPAYMAPEQWQGGQASPSTDVYAATCVFFECVAGYKPYRADEVSALMAQHLTAPIPADDVPPRTRELVLRGLAKEMSGRPESAAAFVAELEAAASAAYGDDWEERGAALLAGAAAALTVLFPLSALLVQGGAAPTVTQTAISTIGRADKGLLAKVSGSKATIAVSGALAVGAATGIVVVGSGPSSPRVHPAATFTVAFPSERKRYSDVPLETKFRYAQVGGVRSRALQDRINRALRWPIDDWSSRYHSSLLDLPSGSIPFGVATSTVKVTLRTARLLALSYDFSPPAVQNPRSWISSGVGVTVDLATGRLLGPHDVFRPSAVPVELTKLLLLAPTTRRQCDLINPSKYSITWSALTGDGRDPHVVESVWTADHVSFTLFLSPLGCTMADGWHELDVPYKEIVGMMNPDVAALVPR